MGLLKLQLGMPGGGGDSIGEASYGVLGAGATASVNRKSGMPGGGATGERPTDFELGRFA